MTKQNNANAQSSAPTFTLSRRGEVSPQIAAFESVLSFLSYASAKAAFLPEQYDNQSNTVWIEGVKALAELKTALSGIANPQAVGQLVEAARAALQVWSPGFCYRCSR